jgi:hypothetical protein
VTAAVLAAAAFSGCGDAERPVAAGVAATGAADTTSTGPSATADQAPAGTTGAPPTTVGPEATTAPPTTEGAVVPAPAPTRPPWLGQRPLPLDERGFGQVQSTPPELVDRRLPTDDVLAPPADDRFVATVDPVPDEVLARSTWHPGCPVGVADLRYVTVAFWGFDDRPHTGELLVHTEVADDVVGVFERLHAARFPLEEVRVTRADELDLHPTGDGNNTAAFVCRAVRGAGSWSQHAYGLAVDINPFHNPYQRGELVLPELASAYLDRDDVRPGMIVPGDVVTTAFAELGWEWGGTWHSGPDYMHFSRHGG